MGYNPSMLFQSPKTTYVFHVLALSLIYFLFGQAALRFDAVSGFAAAVWPPTGISLYALVTYGISLWPGIFIGALFVNVVAGAPLLAALGMSSGNTAEALLAAYLLTRQLRFNPSLQRLRDVLALVVCGAILSTLISASVGVLSGYVAGVIPKESLTLAWRAWWVGDMMSDLIIAPMLFTFASRGELKIARLTESILLAVVAMWVNYFVFFSPSEGIFRLRPYLMFPLIIWTGLRFNPFSVSLLTAFVSVLSILSIASGYEPFTRQGVSEGLIAVQAFIGTLSATGLILSAEVARRRRTEEALVVSESALKTMVIEKDVLLKEIHHRVKNNLQIISSLISLQAASASDKDMSEFYHVTRRRVRSMALIHEQLYRSTDLSAIDMGEYAQSLALEMSSAFAPRPDKILLNVSAEPISLSLEKAIPCGLLLQELVSNAYKHAFPGERCGSVSISLSRTGDGLVCLEVEDDGIGFKPEVELSSARTLGLLIVNTLSQQLGATMTFSANSGTSISLSFADGLEAYENRIVSQIALS